MSYCFCCRNPDISCFKISTSQISFSKKLNPSPTSSTPHPNKPSYNQMSFFYWVLILPCWIFKVLIWVYVISKIIKWQPMNLKIIWTKINVHIPSMNKLKRISTKITKLSKSFCFSETLKKTLNLYLQYSVFRFWTNLSFVIRLNKNNLLN